ncbi:hypothetical protein HF521_000114 [Silurus meridionalis]|uniref:Rad60/SUMO-like domain-containing protein n=1 Tax=Silurus meridionalis TaxID=175797 RepID=A0A8T0BXH4_SILME|nr:hypothetical protein HF521_000114 [Silurus meridionalis]
MSEDKPKEGVKTENDHINLKVAGQDGSVVQFKIKRHTPLSKLMKAYCERQGLSIRQIRFSWRWKTRTLSTYFNSKQAAIAKLAPPHNGGVGATSRHTFCSVSGDSHPEEE